MRRLFSFPRDFNDQAGDPALAGDGMKKLKLVMIGNGRAGVRTLEERLKLNRDH